MIAFRRFATAMTASLLQHWAKSPSLVRVVPFVIFVGITALQGQFGEDSRYWFYLLKTLTGAALVWAMIPWVQEMRWRWSWEALAVGVGVFALWVGLDGFYPSVEAVLKTVLCPLAEPLGLSAWCAGTLSDPTPWNPHTRFDGSWAWGFVLVRLAGSSVVVPALEEVFYRSFLYRYIVRPAFDTVPLNHFSWLPLLFTAAIFGLAHYEWLPAIFCGLLYQGLVIRKNRLGDAMTAHAITNFLLGAWIIWKGAWHLW